MPELYPHTAGFLRSLHRRLFWVRLAERVGVCLAWAAVMALLMVPLLMIRGQSGLPFCLTVLAGATVIGIAWGMTRRPCLIDAAILADRQLHLHDLLSTAALLAKPDRQPTDNWQKIVFASADARCEVLSAGDVLFRRWGGRAWGSTGLLLLLALTLAMLSVNPAPIAARQTTSIFLPNPLTQSIETRQNPDAARGPAVPSAPRPFRASASVDDEGLPSAPTVESVSQHSQSAQAPSNHAAAGASSNDASDGAGSATGGHTKPLAMLSPPVGSPEATASQEGTMKGGAGGGGGATTSAGKADAKTGATANGQTKSSPSVPWQTPTWAADRRRAQAEIQDRHFSDTYRTLIADYFRED